MDGTNSFGVHIVKPLANYILQNAAFYVLGRWCMRIGCFWALTPTWRSWYGGKAKYHSEDARTPEPSERLAPHAPARRKKDK